MRAHCHKQEGRVAHRLYENLRHGYLVQDEEARQLHSLAGVPEGPCGVEELQQFQQALGSQYQLLVMCHSKPFSLIFKEPVAPHQIRLLKSDQHYAGCTSFPAFVNRTHCLKCEKGYNEDVKNHPCRGTKWYHPKLCSSSNKSRSKAFAKLMLNSFWGKFGERQNKSVPVTVQEPSHLFSLLTDDTLDISTIRLCTEDVLEVVNTSQHDAADKGTKVNIFIAAFTTCHACLKLYQALHTVKQQVLYKNTDSVIYRWSPGQPIIPTGDYLGEMTNKLEEDVIVEFVSGGAKNLGYRTCNGKVECKVWLHSQPSWCSSS